MIVHYANFKNGLSVGITRQDLKRQGWSTRWPGATICDAFWVQLEPNGDLVDISNSVDIDGRELTALLSDCFHDASKQSWRKADQRKALRFYANEQDARLA